jgi:ribonuclease Y
MNTTVYILIALVAGLVVGAGVIYILLKNKKTVPPAVDTQAILEKARQEAEKIKRDAQLEAKDILYKARVEADRDIKERQRELDRLEKRLRHKEENLDRRLEKLEQREQAIQRKETELQERHQKLSRQESEIQQMIEEEKKALERLSGMSTEEAKAELFRRVEEETRFEMAKMVKRIEDEAREEAEKKAREIIGLAIQRYANEYVADFTVSSVPLPNDEMKGRIIGREGRNIRALEAATGVDLIVDDTPETVTISCFDPVRREIARVSLERLIADGRIHPARIEEVVDKVRREINAIIKEEGEKAVFELGISGVHPELIKLLGRLKYRTSYGQNVLQHSIEVAYLAGMMAAEIGADEKLARRAGLLHDIGKAVDHEMQGSHHEIGVNLAKKYGENEYVLNAIACHHGDVDPICVEAALVAAADALSAARPGVRRESIEAYIQRLKRIEEIATSYEGVEKCYAMQAGREIRVIVKPDSVPEEMASMISKEIAKKIESELSYPGQIKVMVIRERRFVEYAK